MQFTALALIATTAATAVLAAGAPPVTTTTASSVSVPSSQAPSASHSETATQADPKPQGTGAPSGGSSGPQQAGGRPQVHVIVESPAADDACGKGTNTTVLVPIGGVYANRTVLSGKIAALYLTEVTGGHPPPPLADITCIPYLKENGTGTPAGSAFTFGTPLSIAPTVGTPNHIGSIFCMVPIPAGGIPGMGGGKPPGGQGVPGATGAVGPTGGANGGGSANATFVTIPPASSPTPVSPTVSPPGSPPPPAQSAPPASGVGEFSASGLVSVALFGVLAVMFTL
ncbi:hypothetical protein PG985_013968 [Apiospora marii]|uniref:Uncharacterized protein n=1 Tax=Apiospora marii TaxID=335849 RepID=A0ABR1R6B2_9PEZI